MERWIDYKEVKIIAKCGESSARKIIQAVNKEIMDNNGIVPIKGRAPRSTVLEKLGIKENT